MRGPNCLDLIESGVRNPELNCRQGRLGIERPKCSRCQAPLQGSAHSETCSTSAEDQSEGYARKALKEDLHQTRLHLQLQDNS